MYNTENTNIANISLHYIGNKNHDEAVHISPNTLQPKDDTKDFLITYFTSSFKSNEYLNFYHDIDKNMNEVFVCISKIFDNPKCLHEQSINLAKHLYEQSNHPKIKSGEFYVVYLKNCIIDNEIVDAVGLFKSENKDTFLKVYPSSDGFEIETQQGVNINKLDKGALIFNVDRENGYVVAVVDNTNKGVDAHYWIDDFLHVRQRRDEYYNTQNVMTLARNFVVKELPKTFEVSKADQAEILNKTSQFFKKNGTFEMEEFINAVMEQPEVIDSFNQYKESYAQKRDIEFIDSFSISDTAVRKQAKLLKSVIKLDDNFHIYVHGDRQLIEQGEDDKGKFYKVYYKEEQ